MDGGIVVKEGVRLFFSLVFGFNTFTSDVTDKLEEINISYEKVEYVENLAHWDGETILIDEDVYGHPHKFSAVICREILKKEGVKNPTFEQILQKTKELNLPWAKK